jgi:hypothetical protein
LMPAAGAGWITGSWWAWRGGRLGTVVTVGALAAIETNIVYRAAAHYSTAYSATSMDWTACEPSPTSAPRPNNSSPNHPSCANQASIWPTSPTVSSRPRRRCARRCPAGWPPPADMCVSTAVVGRRGTRTPTWSTCSASTRSARREVACPRESPRAVHNDDDGPATAGDCRPQPDGSPPSWTRCEAGAAWNGLTVPGCHEGATGTPTAACTTA